MKWNVGRCLVLGMAIEDFVIAGVFAYSRDFKHAAYWFFAGCITGTTLYL